MRNEIFWMGKALMAVVVLGCSTTDQRCRAKFDYISSLVDREEELRYLSHSLQTSGDGFSRLVRHVSERSDYYFSLLGKDVGSDAGIGDASGMMQVRLGNRFVNCMGYMPRCFSLARMLAIAEIDPCILGQYIGHDRAQALILDMLNGLQNIGADNWRLLDKDKRVIHELSARWSRSSHDDVLNAEFDRLLGVMNGATSRDATQMNLFEGRRVRDLAWVSIWGTESECFSIRKLAKTEEDIAFVKWLCDRVLPEEHRIKAAGVRPGRLTEMRLLGSSPCPVAVFRADVEQQLLVRQQAPMNVRIYALQTTMPTTPRGAAFQCLRRALDMFNYKKNPVNLIFVDLQNAGGREAGTVPEDSAEIGK